MDPGLDSSNRFFNPILDGGGGGKKLSYPGGSGGGLHSPLLRKME